MARVRRLLAEAYEYRVSVLRRLRPGVRAFRVNELCLRQATEEQLWLLIDQCDLFISFLYHDHAAPAPGDLAPRNNVHALRSGGVNQDPPGGAVAPQCQRQEC